MRKTKTAAASGKLSIEKIETELKLEGFAMSRRKEPTCYGPNPEYVEILVIKNARDGVTFEIEFYSNGGDKWSLASGHTSFMTSKGVMTYDRRGVSDSFYLAPQDTIQSLKAMLDGQLKKIEDSRKRIDASVVVPGLPGSFMVTPDRKAEITERLRASRPVHFTPAGFGTGWELYTGRQQSRFDKPASAELKRFFDFGGPLFLRQMDCD